MTSFFVAYMAQKDELSHLAPIDSPMCIPLASLKCLDAKSTEAQQRIRKEFIARFIVR